MTIENEVFKPHNPSGLDMTGKYKLTMENGSYIKVELGFGDEVFVDVAGSCGHMATSWANKDEHPRTHQALIWLAEAIRLDNEQE